MRRCLAIVTLAFLSACAGGSSTLVPGRSPASGSGTSATLTISIPHAAAGTSTVRRTPAYVSASTQSITVSVSPSVKGFPISANVTPNSPGCNSTQNATVCDLQLPIQPGQYIASLTTYDGLNGTGNALSTDQSLPLNVSAGRVNNLAVTLGGIPTSVQFVAPGGQAGVGALVLTLASNDTGTITAYGADADGNLIVGAGAPTVTSATSDNAAQIAVAPLGSSEPNVIALSSLATNAIAHITVTVTPVAGSGSGPVTRTVTVQPPAFNLLYFASSYSVHVFDATATDITPSGGFGGLQQGAGASGLAYDSANGEIYIAVQATPSLILAFDKSGNPQALNANTTGLPVITGLTYDPVNGLIYAGGQSEAFNAAGVATAIANAPYGYNIAYDAHDNVIVSGTQALNPDGTLHGTLPFSGDVGGLTYDPVSNLFYVYTYYPTTLLAYTTSGVQQALSGSFSLLNASEYAGAIAADPTNGNVYVATFDDQLYGFDQNGNALPAPWHTISGVGTPSGAGGMALVPP